MAIHDEGQLQRDIAAEMVAESGWRQRPAAEVDRASRLLVDDLVGYLRCLDRRPGSWSRRCS